MSRVRVIGLTGQTGAGKSTVSNVFYHHGFAIINADEIARKVVEPWHPCLAEVFAAFGDGVRAPDGTLDRKALANIVFHDKAQLERLNHIMHPHITRMIQGCIEPPPGVEYEYAVIDAPTLFESGEDKMCDCIVSVTAPAEIRMQRIIERDHLTQAQAQARMDAQLSEDFFRTHSDYIIQNDSTLPALTAAAEETVGKILSQFSK